MLNSWFKSKYNEFLRLTIILIENICHTRKLLPTLKCALNMVFGTTIVFSKNHSGRKLIDSSTSTFIIIMAIAISLIVVFFLIFSCFYFLFKRHCCIFQNAPVDLIQDDIENNSYNPHSPHPIMLHQSHHTNRTTRKTTIVNNYML
jgi:hypothetical protein